MFTIVTATLNAAATVERALDSLARQSRPFQHLVIDGGSADETAGKCGNSGFSEVVIAPGSSIYEAWNIGIARATGDWILFLNADDELAPDCLKRIAEAACRDPSAWLAAGNASLVDDDAPLSAPTNFIAVPDGRLDTRTLALGVPAINAMAFRRETFQAHGPFPTHYRAAGDRAFLLRLAMAEDVPTVVRIDAELYRYHAHGGSLTLRRSLRQRLMIATEHMALASELLEIPSPREREASLRFWRRREAAVGCLRCLAAAKPLAAAGFAGRLTAGEWRDLTRPRTLDH